MSDQDSTTSAAGRERGRVEVLTSLDDERIAQLRAQDTFFWIDLHAPDADEIDRAGRIFGLHELAVEDLQRFGQRPKIDEYPDCVHMVVYGVHDELQDEPMLIEVHVFVHGGFVLTVRRQQCPELDALRRRFESNMRGVEPYVVYRVVDALTDTFFPVLEQLDSHIDELEDGILTSPGESQLHVLFSLKRQLVALRKVVTPQRDLMATATDRIIDIPGLEPGSRDYFRDVYDHTIRISDLIDTYRDLLTGAMDVYLSMVANRQNDVMKQVSLIATIFLPLTFLTGFFGQNFAWLVRRMSTEADFLVFGVGSLVVSCVLFMVVFARRGWFAS